MGLNIKNPEVEAKIRRLANVTGENLTRALDRAVQEKLDRLEPARPRETAEELLAKAERWRRKFNVDTTGLSSDHSWLYDENGLPT